MLTDRDRTLLAPHLALLRTARSELTSARQSLDDAGRQADDSRGGTDWRDRLFGGLLSVDEGRSRRFRDAKRGRKTAQSAVDEAAKRYAKYATRMDQLLEPMLRRDDPAFRKVLAAIKECDQTLRSCEWLRDHISSALSKPAQNVRQARPERDTSTWHEAEFARRRFDELAAEVQAAVPKLVRSIAVTARAVGEATTGRPPVPVRLNTAGLNRRGRAAEQPLRSLQRQLDEAIKEITRWRARADEERTASLRAAQERL
ncbi:hypothetical protein [Paractinoplanes durhamensis]|uniref:Uncharacterized protein n=1 Tax=Paractinoplanes durhamensis TaxID=113563 RepID=A0ABQ3YYW2_9ACTN|nr:hypothetical protein [Actinoplanes durhamensis]GIE02710.1 hypothetical protein Adu01nite_40600 [Actinoplanes durhamensis]